jgi:hypothetical protein
MSFSPSEIGAFVPKKDPWDPPDVSQGELIALKALAGGVANSGQQAVALAVIIRKFACAYDMTFRPGGHEGDRAASFAEGKRFVASRIIEAINRPLKPGEQNEPTNPTPGAKERRPKPAWRG